MYLEFNIQYFGDDITPLIKMSVKWLWGEETGSRGLIIHIKISFIGCAYQGKDIVFIFIIECNGLRDSGPLVIDLTIFI